MRLSEKRSDFLWMVKDLLDFAEKFGLKPDGNGHMRGVYLTIGNKGGWTRCLAEQKKFMAQGFSWTLKSKHILGLAVDLLLYRDGKPIFHSPIYELLGNFWEDIGGKWGVIRGGKQVDPYHFEYNTTRRAGFMKGGEIA